MLFRVKLPLDCLEAIGIYRCLLQTGILGGLFSCFQDYLIKVFLILSWANHWIIFESFSLDIFNGRVICIYHINLPYFMAPLLFNILESGFILASFYFFFFFFPISAIYYVAWHGGSSQYCESFSLQSQWR